MRIPFNIDEGIVFEDTNQILKWGDNFENIKKIDNPEITVNGTVLKWFDKLCFGGQRVNITIVKDQYYNKNGALEFVQFEQGRNNARGVFKKYTEIFRKHLGEPSEFNDDGFGRPTELWNIKDLQIIIGIGERFVEYEIFSIHKGQKFWTLNAYQGTTK
jgi:hypothetical protein